MLVCTAIRTVSSSAIVMSVFSEEKCEEKATNYLLTNKLRV